MNSFYHSCPPPPLRNPFSIESRNPTQTFSQDPFRNFSKSQVPNELFYGTQKRVKLEGRYVTLPPANQETINAINQRGSNMVQEITPFQQRNERSNLPVAPVNQRTKEPIENQQTLNNSMIFLPSNSNNTQNRHVPFHFNCPPVGFRSGSEDTFPLFSPQNFTFSNIPAKCSNSSSIPMNKPSLPRLSNDDPIWEYLAKEQEDFKQFVQKIKEIVAACTNPTEDSEDEEEPFRNGLDRPDQFNSDLDDEVFFPREISRLKKTPSSKKKASQKKILKKNSQESAKKEKKTKKMRSQNRL